MMSAAYTKNFTTIIVGPCRGANLGPCEYLSDMLTTTLTGIAAEEGKILKLYIVGCLSVCTRVKAVWLWFYMYKFEIQN